MAPASSERGHGIVTQVVVGVVVTVVGGLVLAFVRPAGTVVRVSGEGFRAGESVTIRFHTEQCAETSVDASGTFAEVSCTIPGDWRFTGQFDVIASGSTSLHAARAPFRVT